MLHCFLCKSCMCWISSCCLNILLRLKAGLKCLLTKGPEREEGHPSFFLRLPWCLQLVPGVGRVHPCPLVLWSSCIARRDRGLARALAPVPGSVREMLWLQSAWASRILLHPVPKHQSKGRDRMGCLCAIRSSFSATCSVCRVQPSVCRLMAKQKLSPVGLSFLSSHHERGSMQTDVWLKMPLFYYVERITAI